MDRSWMYIDILDEKYQHGVRDFCKTAVENLLPKDAGYIKCPCRDCGNVKKYQRIEEIKYHLSTRGFTQNYTVWQWHGEDPNDVPKYRGSDSRHDSEVNDANMNDNCDFEVCDLDEENNSDDDSSEDDQIDAMLEDVEEHFSGKPNAHKNLIDASKIPLYPGCPPQRNKLAFVLKLLNVKASNGWSDKSFTTLLEILHDDLPDQNEVPTSTYEAKKLLRPLGMEYKKIHACPKDCILYWKKYEHHTSCPFCGLSRYKLKEKNGVSKHGPPAKVLWYLPIIPRFKRLFAVEKDAKNLTWHATDRIKDGKLRHPADSPQWRNIDKMFPEFGNETRNLRLGLCTDGMNPYGTLSSIHSTWPVLLVIYNLPSWLCMKRKHIMLSQEELEIKLQESQQLMHCAILHISFTLVMRYIENECLSVAKEDVTTLKEVDGGYVPWPTHLIYIGDEVMTEGRKTKKSTTIDQRKPWFESMKQQEMLGDFQRKLHVHAIGMPIDTKSWEIIIPKDVFHYEEEGKSILAFDDIQQLMIGACLNISIIQTYVMCLIQKLEESEMGDSIEFLCPETTSNDQALRKPRCLQEYVHKSLTHAKTKGINWLLIPYHQENHWILLAVCLNQPNLLIFDSLGVATTNINILSMIKVGYEKFRMTDKRLSRDFDTIHIESPKQPGGTECGYYVMSYMKTFCEEVSKLSNINKVRTLFRKKKTYSKEDIESVKEDWAEFIIKSL